MNKLTVIINDYAANCKYFISYDLTNIDVISRRFHSRDEHLVKLQILPEFEGYERWDELTPNHYRFLIGRALTVMEEMDQTARSDTRHPDVAICNFMIAAMIMRLENLTCSEIEHFRINRFDNHSVTYDYSGSFEMFYDRPEGRAIDHSNNERPNPFSIVVDNTDDIA